LTNAPVLNLLEGTKGLLYTVMHPEWDLDMFLCSMVR